MDEPDSEADEWLHVVDGEPALEPKLPPLHLCGGLRTPYYPSLTDAELKTIMTHPEIVPSASQEAWRELGARRSRRK